MKQEFLCVTWIYIMVAFVFIGCNTTDVSPINFDMSERIPCVTIVKFKNSLYINHLIVSNYSKDSCGSILMRGNQCERTQWLTFWDYDADGSKIDGYWNFNFPERLRDPFWALPNGWYLVDWAWFGFDTPYPFDGNTILTEVTFDNYREYGISEFDKSVPHKYMGNKDNIFESRRIAIADLMGYFYPDGNYPQYKLHIFDRIQGVDTITTFPNQLFYHSHLSGTRPVSNVTNCLCEIADEMDAYWTILQSELTQLINNGDLDNLEKFDITQLYTDEGKIKW